MSGLNRNNDVFFPAGTSSDGQAETALTGVLPPIDLQHFTFASMVDCSRTLRTLGENVSFRQQVAARIVDLFYDTFVDANTGERACVLVRCFETAPYARLPLDYRDAADRLLAEIPSQPNMRCLTLQATRGMKQLWNDPATSVGHQAIPLPSAEIVRKAPMISRLLDQLGLPAEQLLATPSSTEIILDTLPRSFNVFHVPRAPGSPFIPAQDFIKSNGVRSVVGLGGLLPDGELFAVILFCRVPISREVASLFRTLALSVKLSLLRFAPDQVFAGRNA